MTETRKKDSKSTACTCRAPGEWPVRTGRCWGWRVSCRCCCWPSRAARSPPWNRTRPTWHHDTQSFSSSRHVCKVCQCSEGECNISRRLAHFLHTSCLHLILGHIPVKIFTDIIQHRHIMSKFHLERWRQLALNSYLSYIAFTYWYWCYCIVVTWTGRSWCPGPGTRPVSWPWCWRPGPRHPARASPPRSPPARHAAPCNITSIIVVEGGKFYWVPCSRLTFGMSFARRPIGSSALRPPLQTG